MDIQVNKNVVIVFDLDDTLYNEVDYLRSAFKEIARSLEPNAWRKLFVDIFSLYRNRVDVFEFLANNYEIEKKELKQIYNNHLPSIKPFTLVEQTIEAIKFRNGSIAIITDGYIQRQTNKLNSLNLTEFIDYVVISEAVGTEKPSTNNYKLVSNFFGAETYYYIADNFSKDFISPKKMGWQTIGLIDNGLNIHINHYKQSKEDHWPDHLIFDFGEINITG